MNDIKEILKDYDLKINSLKYQGNIIILETNKGKFVYKENSNCYDIYDYLMTRGFTNFPKSFNHKNTSYDLQEFIEERDVVYDQKLKDLIHLSGKLHKATSFTKEVDMDDLKTMYEKIQKEADYLMKYYNDLNHYIDKIVFMSPAEYLLVSNIDLFYYLLSFVKVESTNWYLHVKTKKVVRFSMIHNNLSLSHLLEGDKPYLISFKNARLDMPFLDLKKIYEENYYNLDLEELLKEYQKEFPLDSFETLFFLINLSIPKRIEFTRDTYLDCYDLNKYLIYLRKIASLIQKNEKKEQKN